MKIRAREQVRPPPSPEAGSGGTAKPDTPCEPPKAATWLLRQSLPPGEAGDTIRGDLIEEWNARERTRAVTRWYWRHALSLAMRYGLRSRIEQPAHARGGRHAMFVDNLKQDLKYALRSYARAPSFTIAILATLALGIGASAAIFSLVHGILLKPLPLPDPDRLVYASEINAKGDPTSVSWPNYLDWRARAQSFQFLGLWRDEPMTRTGIDRAQRLRAGRMTGNMFSVLMVGPSLGRSSSSAISRCPSARSSQVPRSHR
jgi:hypothetical protein